MPLITAGDVEALLQSDITNDADPMFLALRDMATELIDSELGRTAEGGTALTGEVHYVDVATDRSVLLLDRWPIASVEDVREDGTQVPAAEYRVDLDAGKITRLTDTGLRTLWPYGVPIEVDYTPATIPGARTVCAQAVARAFEAGAAFANKPTVLAGLRQLTIGRWSATAETGSTFQNASGALALTDYEKTRIRAYRDRRP